MTLKPAPSRAALRATTVLALFLLTALGGLTPAQAQDNGEFDCALDVGVVLDRSGSMNGPPAITARAGAEALIDALGADDYSGVQSFTQGSLDKTVDNDHARSRLAVNAPPAALPQRGAIDQAETMTQSYYDLINDGRPWAKKFMLILSDGHNPSSTGVASGIRADGIFIFSIAIGDTAATGHMQSLASYPRSVFYHQVNDTIEATNAMEFVRAAVLNCGIYLETEITIGCAGTPSKFKDMTILVGAQQTGSSYDYGDGNVSTFNSTAPYSTTHTYEQPGMYTFTYETSTNLNETYSKTYYLEVPPCPPKPPSAAFQCTWMGGWNVTFQDRSYDPDGEIVQWQWNFMDGNASTEQHPNHTYAEDGMWPVRLDIVDTDGLSDSATRVCLTHINDAPMLIGIDDQIVQEGQTVSAIARATDPDGDSLTYEFDLTGLPESATAHDYRLTWVTGFGDAGTYGPIEVTATDGVETVRDDFMIYVLPYEALEKPDIDRDGVADDADNCPGTPNRDQLDWDNDGIGDACSDARTMQLSTAARLPGDWDGDGHLDEQDNCRIIPNPLQEDMDVDGLGDACDGDLDGDNVPQLGEHNLDNCPFTPNPDQADANQNGIGDICEYATTTSAPQSDEPQWGIAHEKGPDGAATPSLVGPGAAIAAGTALLVALLVFVLRRR